MSVKPRARADRRRIIVSNVPEDPSRNTNRDARDADIPIRVVRREGYWIGETVPAVAKGCAGAAPAVSCHTEPPASVANPRPPVVPSVTGTAVA